MSAYFVGFDHIDAMPESIQDTERGQNMENTASDLNTLMEEICALASTLTEIVEA